MCGKSQGFVGKFKVYFDIFFDYALRGRSRETPPRCLGKRLPNNCKVAVSWSKIVTPLGDAMASSTATVRISNRSNRVRTSWPSNFSGRCKQKQGATFGIVEDAFQRTRI